MPDILVAALIGMTFVAVLIFIVTSKARTERQLHRDTPKSALAKDGPTGSVDDRT